MRTDIEILARIEDVKKKDFFGNQTSTLIMHLAYEAAMSEGHIKSETKREDWLPLSCDKDSISGQMREYMSFAWSKATGHHGLSADRSVCHYQAWIWLPGDEEYQAIDWTRYRNYGAPILRQISIAYGLPYPTDEGAWNMAAGLPCYAGCGNGCGSKDEDDPEEDESPEVESVVEKQLTGA